MMREMGWQIGEAVPEPSSLVALLAMGSVSLVIYVRRRRCR
jgi:hypothetical protein